MKYFTLFLCLLFPTISHAEVYAGYDGRLFPPYNEFLVDMTFDETTANLTISSLAGVPIPSVSTSGDNSEEGVIVIEWPTPDGQFSTFTFTKVLTEDAIEWRGRSADGSSGASFSRPRAGELTEADKTLSYPWGCGIPYGRLTVSFEKDADLDLAREILGADSLSEDSFSNSWAFYGGYERDPERESVVQFGVPIGTEIETVLRLRALPGVIYANLADGGGCGGSELAYMTISRNGIANGESIDAQSLANTLESAVSAYLSTGNVAPTVSVLELKRSILPPYPPIVKVGVVAPSNLTRGEGNTWDSFHLIFEATQAIPLVPSDQLGIVIWSERLMTGTRAVSPGSAPPRSEYIDVQLTSFDEAVVAFLMAKSISDQLDGDCDFFLEALVQTREEMDRVLALPEGCY